MPKTFREAGPPSKEEGSIGIGSTPRSSQAEERVEDAARVGEALRTFGNSLAPREERIMAARVLVTSGHRLSPWALVKARISEEEARRLGLLPKD